MFMTYYKKLWEYEPSGECFHSIPHPPEQLRSQGLFLILSAGRTQDREKALGTRLPPELSLVFQ